MSASGAAHPASPATAPPLERPPGLWRQGWARFKRNRTGMLGLCLIAFVVLVAISAPLLAPYDPNDQSAMLNFRARTAPSFLHPFGTDRMGFDVLSRVIYGARVSLVVGIIPAIIILLVGVVVGLILSLIHI